MLFSTILATFVATAAAAANPKRRFAVLRHAGGGPLMNCRMDPIVQPGGASAHVHTFMGANNINFETTGEDLRKSQCTTALPKADMSAYWFPRLYFKDPSSGKLEPVPFYYMNVYYFFDATNDDLKAFPLGLKFVSGNALTRTPPTTSSIANLDPNRGPVSPAQITCPRKSFSPPSWPAGSDGSMGGIGEPSNQGLGIGFPFQDCDGLYSPMRIDVHFPSCYNPAAGLENFRSNSAFPTDVGGGKLDCPKGWVHVPHIFFETYWDTHSFAGRFSQLAGKESPFVFANGDATGFSAHGDFISGWDEKALQQIVDNCDAGHAGLHQCPGLIGGVNSESGGCKATCPVQEDVDGPLNALPGNNPITGWKYGGGSGGGSTSPAPVEPAPQEPVASSAPAANPPANTAPAYDAPAYTPPVQVPTTFVPIIKAVSSSAASSSSAVVDASSSVKQEQPAPQPTGDYGSGSGSGSGGRTSTVIDTVTVWETKTVYADGPAPTKSSSESGPAGNIGAFKYVGCFRDASDRVLAGKIRPNLGKISNTNCVNYCASEGWPVAGTEYGGQCYCGNGLTSIEKIPESECKMSCEGADNETCGGSWALTLYTKNGKEPKTVAKRHVHDHYMHHRRALGHSH
ncbi:hypothetical protein OQA88_497 [Cercophora sp. LCS_1]